MTNSKLPWGKGPLPPLGSTVHCFTVLRYSWLMCVQMLSGRLAQLESAVAAERARREALEAELAAIKMPQQ